MIGMRTKLKTISYFVQIWLPKFKMAEKVRNILKNCYNQKKYQTEFIFSIAFWNGVMIELRIMFIKRSIFGTNMAANNQNGHGLEVQKFS